MLTRRSCYRNWHSSLAGMWMAQPGALEASLAFLIKTQVLPCDPAIPLPGIYPNELKYYVHTKTYTWLFIAALFPSYKLQRVSSNLLNQEGKVHSYHVRAIFFERQWNLGLALLLKYHSALWYVSYQLNINPFTWFRGNYENKRMF